jgi:hypothetical protein
MNTDIEKRLKKNEEVLKNEFAVKSLKIFGSYARGDNSKVSDIDILVNFNKPVGLSFIELKNYLENLLGHKVDLVTEKALRDSMRKQILSDSITIL